MIQGKANAAWRMAERRHAPEHRKAFPICTGVLDYFPDALLAVAELSVVGNAQHNPGEPLHWAREKSTDEADALLRHLVDRGTRDTDGVRHTAKVAWRALALLQREIEADGPAPEPETPPLRAHDHPDAATEVTWVPPSHPWPE